jgi:hypothetical protein
MGLKSGSRDSGLDEDDDATDDDHTSPSESGASGAEHTGRSASTPDSESETASKEPNDAPSNASERTTGTAASSRPSMESIPYKLRRSRVNEGRDQVPFFLRDEVVEEESELQDSLEDLLGEDVYKSDYREAAMVVAQRNPELVAEVLREWGYDLE